jgi:hypothetical protein
MATVYLSDSVGVQFEKSCFSRRNFGTKIWQSGRINGNVSRNNGIKAVGKFGNSNLNNHLSYMVNEIPCTEFLTTIKTFSEPVLT